MVDRILCDSYVPIAVMVSYVAVGAILILTDYTLNDEGLFTFNSSEIARHFPLETFFVQKSKPLLALLYMPFAGLGLRAFLFAHLLVAACAIPMMAAIARALRHRHPNAPAIVLAASPGFLMSGPAGLSNADGVVATVATLYFLLARNAPVWAGLMLGALPWVRHELALLAFLLFVRTSLFDRNVRFTAATFVFPLSYALLGAWFHEDALWMIHYPPASFYPMPGNTAWHAVSISFLAVAYRVLTVTPLALFALAAPYRRLESIEKWLACWAVAWIACSALLPGAEIAFGFSPRYMLIVLPALALLCGRGLAALQEKRVTALRVVVFAIILAVIWLASERGDGWAVLPAAAISICAAALALAGTVRDRWGRYAFITLAVLGPILPFRTEIPQHELAPYMPRLVEWLRANRETIEGPIFTNVPILAAQLNGSTEIPDLDIRFLIGADQIWHMQRMTSEKQRQKTVEALAVARYNATRGVLPRDLVPDKVPDDSLFVLRPGDSRVDLLLPDQTWENTLVPVADEGFRVLRFVRPRE